MISKSNGFDLNIRWRFPEGKKYAFAFISLFVFLLIIYGNSLQGEWHLDDTSSIVENPGVHLKNLSWPDIKKTCYFRGGLSRPVSYFSFALNYYFDGLNVLGYHLVNLAIHYITAIFLFLFIYNTLKLPVLKERYGTVSYSVALLATFLWAVSPVQVLAVSYIVQRMTSMAGMFYIMAMYLYLKGRTSDCLSNSISFFIFCALSALLSFGSKENAAMLPVTLFLYDLFLIQGITKENLKKNMRIVILPFIVVLALGVCYTNVSTILDDYSYRPFTLMERLLTEPRVIIFYISLLFYPILPRFALLHDIYISRSLFDPWTTLPAILLILLIIACTLSVARKKPLISFCVIFFFLNHLIEGTIIPLELIFEHRNYIPSMLIFVPIAILAVNVLDYLSYKKGLQFLLVLGIAFLLYDQGYTVHKRNEILRYEQTLWLYNVDKYPNLSRAHNNLGKTYMNRGLPMEAFQEVSKALEINRYFNFYNEAIVKKNLGEYYRWGEKYDMALINYTEAVAICPGLAEAWVGIVTIELKKGNIGVAYQHINKALKTNPASAKLHEASSFVLFKLGRLDEALKESQKTLEINSERIFPIAIMAEIARRKGQDYKSIQYWKKFLRKDPNDIRAYIALIELYSLTHNNNLLTQTISQLLNIKGDRNLRDFLHEATKNAELLVYVPDTEKILAIIKGNFLKQIQDINLKNVVNNIGETSSHRIIRKDMVRMYTV